MRSLVTPVTLAAIYIEPIGEVTGQPFRLSGAAGYDDAPKGGPGREPADSFLVDVEVRGPALAGKRSFR